jgi:hypothetical protein
VVKIPAPRFNAKEEFDTNRRNYYTAVVIGKVFLEFRAMAQIPRRPKKPRKLIYCPPRCDRPIDTTEVHDETVKIFLENHVHPKQKLMKCRVDECGYWRTNQPFK